MTPDFAAEDAAAETVSSRVGLAEPFRELEQIRRRNRRRALASAVIWWVILAVLGFVNYLIFHRFGSNYLRWFVLNGALVNAVVVFGSVTLRLDEIPELVSAHPLEYVWGCLQIPTFLSLAWNIGPPTLESTRFRSTRIDHWLTFLAYWIVLIGMSMWIWVVVPLQYWVNAVCGAPARQAAGSQLTTYWQPSRHKFWRVRKDESAPEGGVELSLGTKPVSVTAAFAVLGLYALSRVI
jgi:hypothetical protein